MEMGGGESSEVKQIHPFFLFFFIFLVQFLLRLSYDNNTWIVKDINKLTAHINAIMLRDKQLHDCQKYPQKFSLRK